MEDIHDFEDIQSQFELDMNEKGFDFITNFSTDREPIYRQSAEIHKLKYSIEDETYNMSGNRTNGAKSFYVESTIGDLTDFWKTFNRLKNEGVNT
jgi:hypothetical protein